ncbi:MAG: TonB-dependent receptor [Acidobacteriota bacterium]
MPCPLTRWFCLAAGLMPCFITAASAHEPTSLEDEIRRLLGPTIDESIEVRSDSDKYIGAASTATEGLTGRDDLARRPILREGELLETAPGLIATQHSGGGKANQYFSRGFNHDHGTDLRVEVDGMPVNQVSHGHGQGYADLGFVIPEMVETVRYRKGPYDARDNHASAGSIRLRLSDDLPESFVRLTVGGLGHRRVLVADELTLGQGRLVVGGDHVRHDGPWDIPDDLRRTRAVAKWSTGNAQKGGGITFMAHDADWHGSDQIPSRATADVGRFGQVDPGLGGATSRYSLSGSRHWSGDRSLNRVAGYAIRQDLELFSNFTYLLDDQVDGDQFEQGDDRWTLGFSWERHAILGKPARGLEHAHGVRLRFDDIENGLWRTARRQRLSTTRADAIDELGIGAWYELTAQLATKVRGTFGLRLDHVNADVRAQLARNGGSANDTRLSPRVAFAFGPFRNAELYASYGHGLHSNDARGATIAVDPVDSSEADPVPLLVGARSADLGVRMVARRQLIVALSAFWLELDSELVFVGDAGGTEASGETRRRGFELATTWRPNDWLSLDVDWSWTRARFVNEPAGDRIPGAAEHVVAANLGLGRETGWKGALTWRYLGGRPLVEDDSVRSSEIGMLNARVGWKAKSGGLAVEVDLFNLLDEEDSDIEYFYASRLDGEPVDGVEDVHFHPVEPRAVRVSLGWHW